MSSLYSASRDDLSVTSFGSSVMELDSNAGLDPRARSTSDLFEVPASRMRPKPYKRSSSARHVFSSPQPNNSLSLIPEQQQVPTHLLHSLTPYQKQRRRMKNSFQFPNGESFTPRQKSVAAFAGPTHRLSGPSGTRSNGPGARDMFNSCPSTPKPASGRSDSLARSFSNMPPPLSHRPPASRIQKSSSMSRLPYVGLAPKPSSVDPYVMAAKKEHSASFHSIPNRFDCEPNSHTSSRTQVVSSNNSDTNSSSSLRSHNVASSNTSTDASDSVSKGPVKVNITPPNIAKPALLQHDNMKPLTKINHPGSTKISSGQIKSKIQPSARAQPQPQTIGTKSATPTSQDSKGVKRSTSSRIGSFFRKLLPSKRKKPVPQTPAPQVAPPPSKAVQKTSSDNTANVTSTTDMLPPSPTKSTSGDQFFDDIEDHENEDDDDDDDQLLDIDLVFDSLLLKNDHATLKPLRLPLSEKDSTAKDERPESQALDQHSGTTDEGVIDQDLIREFSRLGSFITDGITHQQTASVPPPRSQKRPRLSNKESVVGFYRHQASQNHLALDPDERLAHSLQRDWESVYYDAVVATSTDVTTGKKLRFSTAVYVKDTYAAAEYERSDKKFIRTRRRMMQTKNMAYIEAVKSQLNQFKKGEMKVHGASIHNTHYFL